MNTKLNNNVKEYLSGILEEETVNQRGGKRMLRFKEWKEESSSFQV